MEVKSGQFSFTLKILNIDRNNPLTAIGVENQGEFGTIHIIPYRGVKIALKSISYGKAIEAENKPI